MTISRYPIYAGVGAFLAILAATGLALAEPPGLDKCTSTFEEMEVQLFEGYGEIVLLTMSPSSEVAFTVFLNPSTGTWTNVKTALVDLEHNGHAINAGTSCAHESGDGMTLGALPALYNAQPGEGI